MERTQLIRSTSMPEPSTPGTRPKVKQRPSLSPTNGSSTGSTPRSQSPRSAKAKKSSGGKKVKPRSARANDGKSPEVTLLALQQEGAAGDEAATGDEAADDAAALLAEAMGSPSQRTSGGASSAPAEARPSEAALLAEAAALLADPVFTMLKPITEAQRSALQPSAESRERVVHRTSGMPSLGMQVVDHPEREGVVIVSALVAELSAAQHGVRVGDLIEAINGTTITSLRHAQSLLSSEWGGSKPLTLSLADATRDVCIVSRPPAGVGVSLTSFHAHSPQSPADPSEPRFGVVVTAVEPGSLAAAAGLERLQVIYSVNGKLATAASVVVAEMNAQRGLSGVATLVVSEHKVADSIKLVAHAQQPANNTPSTAKADLAEVAVSIVHF
jgi:hypothetical protein